MTSLASITWPLSAGETWNPSLAQEAEIIKPPDWEKKKTSYFPPDEIRFAWLNAVVGAGAFWNISLCDTPCLSIKRQCKDFDLDVLYWTKHLPTDLVHPFVYVDPRFSTPKNNEQHIICIYTYNYYIQYNFVTNINHFGQDYLGSQLWDSLTHRMNSSRSRMLFRRKVTPEEAL